MIPHTYHDRDHRTLTQKFKIVLAPCLLLAFLRLFSHSTYSTFNTTSTLPHVTAVHCSQAFKPSEPYTMKRLERNARRRALIMICGAARLSKDGGDAYDSYYSNNLRWEDKYNTDIGTCSVCLRCDFFFCLLMPFQAFQTNPIFASALHRIPFKFRPQSSGFQSSH